MRVYGVWVEMLRRLVPEGRTHRLSPLVGGILQYAAACTLKKFGRRPPGGSVAEALLSASAGDVVVARSAVLSEAVEQLFLDAKVEYLRTGRRRDAYSLVEGSVAEFLRWHAMPWECRFEEAVGTVEEASAPSVRPGVLRRDGVRRYSLDACGTGTHDKCKEVAGAAGQWRRPGGFETQVRAVRQGGEPDEDRMLWPVDLR